MGHFYRIAGDRLIFASTLEALLASGCLETPEIDPESLDLYLALQYTALVEIEAGGVQLSE